MALSAGQAAVVAALKKAGMPITRVNYIAFDYGSDVPAAEYELPDYPWDDDEESLTDFDPDEPRDPKGKWTIGGAIGKALHLGKAKMSAEEYDKKINAPGTTTTEQLRLEKERSAFYGPRRPDLQKPPPGWHDGLKLYHGTSERAANDIMAHGIIAHAGTGGDAWAIKNGLSSVTGRMVSDPHRQVSVYMTSDPDFAKQFAKMAAEEGKSQPVLFEVDVPPDQAKNLKQDEYSEEGHAYRYEGTIPPNWIHLVPFPPKHGIATAFKGMDAEAPTKIYMVIFADGEEDPPATS